MTNPTSLQSSGERCGCGCATACEISIRAGSVECHICHKQICQDCCGAVPVDAPDHKVEFRCHAENKECGT